MKSELLTKFQTDPLLYEEVVSRIILRSPVGGVFVDCGAHAGAHTRHMLDRRDVSQVFAIEAIPALCDDLDRKYRSSEKFRLIRAAVGKEEGEIDFNIAQDNPGFSGILPRNLAQVNRWTRVRARLTTLDSSIKDRSSEVGLIKLDLEGGEFDAMRGGDEVIRRSRPLIIFENGLKKSGDLYGYGPDDFFLFFKQQGYVIHDFFGNTVDPKYWNDVLKTYMFVAVPEDTVHESWITGNLKGLVGEIACSL